MAIVPPSIGRAALTHFRVLSRQSELGISLVEARPHTGRTHQIRVHLAAAGHPIVGDMLYGGTAARAMAHRVGISRPALHAREITFNHPVSGDLIRAAAPLPCDLVATGLFDGLADHANE